MGLASGYWGGKTDAVLQRIVDILMSFPLIILALTLLTALDRSLTTMIVAIGIPFIPYGARTVRASVLVLKESQYVEAARASGCTDLRIICRHVAPGCVAPYLILTTGLTGVAIITEGALGFLGLSIPPPTPTLGGMLAEALTLLMFAPHVAIAPGVFITLAVFAFNMLGDSLRDLLDPRLRGQGSERRPPNGCHHPRQSSAASPALPLHRTPKRVVHRRTPRGRFAQPPPFGIGAQQRQLC